MATRFVTNISKNKKGYDAGKDALQGAIEKLKGENPHLILLFSSSEYDHTEVLKGAQAVSKDIPLIGCSAAGIFTEEAITKSGVCCACIASDTHKFFTGVGSGIQENTLEAVSSAVKNFPADIEGHPFQTGMILVDGLAGKGEEAVLAAMSILGSEIKFAGGAAADNFQFKKTVVFSNGDALENAVNICLIRSKIPTIITVKHGHTPISRPLKVTKAAGNILYEVEGKPAIEAWKTHLKDHLKRQKIEIEKLSKEKLSKILLKYEAGLTTGNEYKIRFPLSANEDGSLNFVCTIAEGSVIRIMDSHEKDQIDSAKSAAETALAEAKGISLAGVIIFDCACRGMILKEKFSEAVKEMNHIFKKIPMIGFETYGEIAKDKGQLSGFHNTTTVIMLIPS